MGRTLSARYPSGPRSRAPVGPGMSGVPVRSALPGQHRRQEEEVKNRKTATPTPTPTPADTIPLTHFRPIRTGAWFERIRQASGARRALYALVYNTLLHLARGVTPRTIPYLGKGKQPLRIQPGQCWVTCQEIVDLTGISESTVRRALQFWERLGVIQRELIKRDTHVTVGQLITLVYWKQDVVPPSKKNGMGTGETEESQAKSEEQEPLPQEPYKEVENGVGDRVSRRTSGGVRKNGHRSRVPGVEGTWLLDNAIEIINNKGKTLLNKQMYN